MTSSRRFYTTLVGLVLLCMALVRHVFLPSTSSDPEANTNVLPFPSVSQHPLSSTCPFPYNPPLHHHVCLGSTMVEGEVRLRKALFCKGIVRGFWNDVNSSVQYWNNRVKKDHSASSSSYLVLHGGLGVQDMIRCAKCIIRYLYLNEERQEPPASIAEIGTGAATMLSALCNESSSPNLVKCYGVDPSPAAVHVAQRTFPELVTDVATMLTTSTLPQVRDGVFDLVLSYGVVIYLTEQQFCSHIADALMHLQEGGQFQLWHLSDTYRGGIWKWSMGRTHVHPSVFNSSRGVLWPCEGLGNYVKSITIVRRGASKPLHPSKTRRTRRRAAAQPEIEVDDPVCWNVNYLGEDEYVVLMERNSLPRWKGGMLCY
eukprot:PhF_6_TR32197/c0_g1_i1/m.47843